MHVSRPFDSLYPSPSILDVWDPPSSAASVDADNVFTDHGFCAPKMAVIMAQSVGNFDVRSDGYIDTLFHRIGLSIGPDHRSYSYFDFLEPEDVLVAGHFISADNRSTVLFFLEDGGLPFYTELETTIARLHTKPDRFRVEATSRRALDDTNEDAVSDDLAKMDMITIPLALVVLMWRISSVPLILVTLITMPISLLLALSWLDAQSSTTAFPNFSTALFISTAVALGFDWNLFLLTRYGEGVQRGTSNPACVKDTIVFAGRTVVVSGATLIASYLSLLGFPTTFVRSIGIGAAITLTAGLIVNITLTPALLYLFPRFFRAKVSLDCCWSRLRARCTGTPEAEDAQSSHDDDGEPTPSVTEASRHSRDRKTRDIEHDVRDERETDVRATAPLLVSQLLLEEHDLTGRTLYSRVEDKTFRAVRVVRDLESSESSESSSRFSSFPSLLSSSALLLTCVEPENTVRDRLARRRSIWYRLVVRVSRHPWWVVVIVLVLGAPLMYCSTRLTFSIDQNQLHPHNKARGDER